MLNERSLSSQFLHFVAATVASLMVFSLYSIVDGLMVAKGVGEYAMAAVNLAVPFTNVLFSIGVIFAVGTSTIIAIYLGQNQGEKANSLFSQNIVLLTCIGLTISVLVFVFLEPFAVLLGAKGVTYQYTIDYLRGLAPFALCFIVSYNMEVLIKTDGYPRLAILTVITGCLANCVLDYIAIFILDWGVWGAAFATGLSQLLTCIIYLRHFLGGHNTFHFVKFRMDWGIYKRLIPLGFADGVTELCNGVMIFLFNRVILRCLGDDGLVCYTIIAYVNTLIINTMLGISQGSQPLVSYHYGKGDAAGYKKLLRYGFTAVGIMTAVIFAGVMIFAPQIAGIFLGAEKPERVPQGYRAANRMIVLISVLLCVLLELFRTPIIAMFLDAAPSPETVATGEHYLQFIGFFFCFIGFKMAVDGILRGAGDVKMFTIANLVNLAIRVLLSWLCAPLWGVEIVWYAVPVGWLANFVISFAHYRTGKWKEKRIA